VQTAVAMMMQGDEKRIVQASLKMQVLYMQDEPTSGLDATAATDILTALRRQVTDLPVSFLCIPALKDHQDQQLHVLWPFNLLLPFKSYQTERLVMAA